MLGHLVANYQTSTQTDESIKGIVLCRVTNKLQASQMRVQAFTRCQRKSSCLHFLALFPVLTSWSGRLLPRLGKLASSTSRFLSYQLHYPNERRGSIPSSCTNMPGIDTHWCGLGHMTIPKQGGVAKELSTLAKPGSYAHRGTMDKQGWNGLTKEIWVLLLEKERTSAAKPTVCLCLKTGIASFHHISHCLGSFS